MAECRICHVPIDKENDDWVMPSKNWYYHRQCYEDWKKSEPLKDEEWRPFIYDFQFRSSSISRLYPSNSLGVSRMQGRPVSFG